MPVSKKQAMEMFDHDLTFFMNEIRRLLAHYRIGDWEAYLFFRKPDCPQSYVLKYEATAGDEFAQKIVALHAAPAVDTVQVERSRIAALCLARAAEYKQARDNAYEAVPTCDAVGENEIRQHVAERLAAEIAAPASPSPAEPRTWIDSLVGAFDDSPLNAEVLENEHRAREAMDAAAKADNDNGERCAWTLDDSNDGDVWETGCGEMFQFNEGGPSGNKFIFCYKCGKRIDPGRYSDHAADSVGEESK